MPGTPNQARAFLQSQGVKPEYFNGAAFAIEPVVKVVEDLLSRISGLSLDVDIADFVAQFSEPIVASVSPIERGAGETLKAIDSILAWWGDDNYITQSDQEAAVKELRQLRAALAAAPASVTSPQNQPEIAGYHSTELADISSIITWLHAQNRPMGELVRRFYNDATRGKLIKEYNDINPLAAAPSLGVAEPGGWRPAFREWLKASCAQDIEFLRKESSEVAPKAFRAGFEVASTPPSTIPSLSAEVGGGMFICALSAWTNSKLSLREFLYENGVLGDDDKDLSEVVNVTIGTTTQAQLDALPEWPA